MSKRNAIIEEIEAVFTIDDLPRSSDVSQTVSRRARVEQ